MALTRRNFLAQGAVLGCSAAASPLVTPMAFAQAPWDTRLIVLILRGGMDGLDVVQPYGDPDFGGLRTVLAGGEAQGATDLDGFYALHPGLSDLLPLWRRGQLAFAHAVSTPYRDRRSHFYGQDLLEAGTGFSPDQPAPRDGWLNRMLQVLPGLRADTAYAIGREDLLLLTGEAEVANWSPDTRFAISPQARRLFELVYENDPLFHASIIEALDLSERIAAYEAQAEGDEDAAAMAALMEQQGPGRRGAPRGDGRIRCATIARGEPDRRVLDQRLGHASLPAHLSLEAFGCACPNDLDP